MDCGETLQRRHHNVREDIGLSAARPSRNQSNRPVSTFKPLMVYHAEA
jgi:hypothetical protein